jgi:tetratricopeptide (TPR) repeat protein
VLLTAALSLWGEAPPAWFIPLREAVYEQRLHAAAVAPLYQEVRNRAGALPAGAERFVMLSRCEYMMGRVFQEDKRNPEALARYDEGIALAEKSLAVRPTAAAYEILAGNIGQACMIRSTAWVMTHGLKVEQNAKKALELDPRNAGARYLISSRWIFGPGIFGDPQRGIKEMEDILGDPSVLQKDDRFNVYSALAYGYVRLKKYGEGRPWIDKALELYPGNKFARDLLSQIERAGT